jgi:Phosphotransferase enzyme family
MAATPSVSVMCDGAGAVSRNGTLWDSRCREKQWLPQCGPDSLATRETIEGGLMSVEDAGSTVDETGGELLAGGMTTPGVVRIGNTVHRPLRRWTTTVHAVLRHLEQAGFTGAPRVLGFDDAEREVLTFLEGETVADAWPWPAWVSSDETLTQVGSWLRGLHDATVDFVPPEDELWFVAQCWRPGLVIGHNDAAPYNAVWRRGRLVGFVDWDLAGPCSRESDLAYSALMWVPLLAPGSAWPMPSRPVEERYRRLHLLLDAYGYDDDRCALRAAVATRARRNAEVIRRLADGGDPVFEALRGQADDLDRAAGQVDDLPESFWRRAPADLRPRRQEAHQGEARRTGE